MGKVHYKFTYNAQIDFPETIEFAGKKADLDTDSTGSFTIEGDVEDVSLYADGTLPIYVSTTGKTGRTWELEVTFDGTKIKVFPIKGTIKAGVLIVNKKYKLAN